MYDGMVLHQQAVENLWRYAVRSIPHFAIEWRGGVVIVNNNCFNECKLSHEQKWENEN